MRVLRGLTLTATALALSIAPLSAATINKTYSGTFPGVISGTLPDEGTALDLKFNLTSPGILTLTTTSYMSGGFEPNINIFDSHGMYVDSAEQFGAADRSISEMLGAGMYTVSLTDFEYYESAPGVMGANFGDGKTFIDENGATRTGAYSLTANFTATPEPATLLLSAPLLGGLFLLRRKLTVSK